MFKFKQVAQCCLLLVGAVQQVCALTEEEENALMLMAADTNVSIASGREQPLQRAPATATVITARDIETMGAIDLDQIMESVPGVHVSPYSINLRPRYSFRGILGQHNPHVLMMINGQPITQAVSGDRGQTWGGMPVENISRIEVIRGPGSALYGAEAVAGVINIITKTAQNINGLEYGARLGSFNSKDAWLQYGGQLAGLDTMFYLRSAETDGYRGILEKDAASLTGISNAPGPLNTYNQAIDARTDIAWQQWRLRASYQQRESGMGGGVGNAIDNTTRGKENRLYWDVSYDQKDWLPKLRLSATVGSLSYHNYPDAPGYYTLFPAGAIPGYPKGFLGGPSRREQQTYGNVSAFYSGIKGHEIHVGIGHRYTDLYEVGDVQNFDAAFAPLVGGLQDVSNNPKLSYMMPGSRGLSYIFAQDEWTFIRDWTLTAGVRYDKYSDFGSTTNPRLALVWDAAYNLTVKAMYGNAFRAPSFAELYAINNPVTLGDPKIKPERISTTELAVAWQPTASVQTNISLFRYRLKDIIVATTPAYKNMGEQTGHGLEAEATWEASRELRIKGNISLQRSTDEASGKDAGLVPHTHIFARADWQFAPYWYFAPTINYVADREREPTEILRTTKVPDYTTVDLNLRREQVARNWNFRLNVINLFNAKAYEPTIVANNGQSDIPLSQRAIFLQVARKLP